MSAGIITPAPREGVDSATDVSFSDLNSLVVGDLSHVAWTIGVTNPPATRCLAGDSAIGAPILAGLRSLVYLNSDGYAVRDAFLERPFTVPAGVTAVTLELDEVQIPSGSTGSFALQLFDATGITQISSTTFTPTTTPTNIVTAQISVTAGLEYKVRVNCNPAGAGQSQFWAGKFRVLPSTTSGAGVFGAPFKRVEFYGAVQDTNQTLWLNPRYPPQDECSSVEMETNASSVAVEVWSNTGNYIGVARADITPFVDRFPLDPPLQPTVYAVSYLAVTVPGVTWNSPRSLRLSAGPAVDTAYTSVPEVRITALAALYVSATAYVKLHSAPVEFVVEYGDSKTAQFYSDSPGRDGFANQLRQKNWRVISQASGGRTLIEDVGSTLTVAACTAFAMQLARWRPTKIHVRIGRNDWTGSTYTAANLVTQIGNLCDAIHAVLPGCTVVIGTWTSEGTETAEGGVAWDTERANIIALASTRTPWCVVLDEARYWTPAEASTYTADTVHPNSLGQERITRGLVSQFHGLATWPWSPLELGPLMWFESNDPKNMVGGAMGSVTGVTGSGNPLPTVTFTGNAAIACQLIVAIVGGGAVGSATFQASVDGGRTFPFSGTTAATVLLAPLGVTINFGSNEPYDNEMYWYANSKIATWKDLSGNGNNLTQATGASQPTYNPIWRNSRPALSFSSSYMNTPSQTFSSPYTVAFVAQETVATNLSSLISPPTLGTGPLLYENSGSGVISLYDGASPGQVNQTFTSTNPNTIVGVSNTTSSFVRVNGSQGTTGTVGAVTLASALTVGYDIPNGVPWNGTIAAMVLINRALSSSELLNLEARWRFLYGLS